MQGAIRYAIIAGVVLVLLIIGIILAGIFGVLQEVLYIFLMILAALLIAATLFQVYWIIMLIRTVSTVRSEVQPLLNSIQQTVGIVQDTAKTAGHTAATIGSVSQFARDLALGPSVRVAASIIAGLQMINVFFGKGRTRHRADERRKQQMEAGAVGGD
jgi:hypothetical protein